MWHFLCNLHRFHQLLDLRKRILLGSDQWRTLYRLSQWMRYLWFIWNLLQLSQWILSLPEQLFELPHILFRMQWWLYLHLMFSRNFSLKSLRSLHRHNLSRLNRLHQLCCLKQLHKLHPVLRHIFPWFKRSLSTLLSFHHRRNPLLKPKHSNSMPKRLQHNSDRKILSGGYNLYKKRQKLQKNIRYLWQLFAMLRWIYH